MPDIKRFTYCKPIPLGDWNPLDQLITNLLQLESTLEWTDYQVTDKPNSVVLTHKSYKYNE